MGTAGLAVSSVARDAGEPASRLVAVRAIQAFTGDLFNRLAARPGNLVCSPYSVAVALAMTRNGARVRPPTSWTESYTRRRWTSSTAASTR